MCIRYLVIYMQSPMVILPFVITRLINTVQNAEYFFPVIQRDDHTPTVFGILPKRAENSLTGAETY